jgi:hypothetical protein
MCDDDMLQQAGLLWMLVRQWFMDLSESLEQTCPFCRHPLPATRHRQDDANVMKDLMQMTLLRCDVGVRHYGKGDYGSAFEYLSKAARLGDATAHFHLSLMYLKGKGVEKDEKMVVYHAERPPSLVILQLHSLLDVSSGTTAVKREK